MAVGKDSTDDNGWAEYKRLILSDREATEKYREESRRDLESFRKEMRTDNQKLREVLSDEVSKIKSEIAVLKVKASLWGTLGGAGATLLMTIGLWILQRVAAP